MGLAGYPWPGLFGAPIYRRVYRWERWAAAPSSVLGWPTVVVVSVPDRLARAQLRRVWWWWPQ